MRPNCWGGPAAKLRLRGSPPNCLANRRSKCLPAEASRCRSDQSSLARDQPACFGVLSGRARVQAAGAGTRQGGARAYPRHARVRRWRTPRPGKQLPVWRRGGRDVQQRRADLPIERARCATHARNLCRVQREAVDSVRPSPAPRQQPAAGSGQGDSRTDRRDGGRVSVRLPRGRSGTQDGGALCGLATSSGRMETALAVLAIGHGARDTYKMSHRHGLPMVQKPFQLGLHIEQPQEQVNRAPSTGQRSWRRSSARRILRWWPAASTTCFRFACVPGAT